MLTRDATYELEQFVDRHELRDVVTALSEICALKAAHIRENWQDGLTARQWDKASEVLERAERQIPAV